MCKISFICRLRLVRSLVLKSRKGLVRDVFDTFAALSADLVYDVSTDVDPGHKTAARMIVTVSLLLTLRRIFLIVTHFRITFFQQARRESVLVAGCAGRSK